MKRVLAVVLIVVLLGGCSVQSELDRALAVREKLLQSSGCGFDAVITADYGDQLYTFRMVCSFDNTGSMTFQVAEPETIAGITGSISDDSGNLTFDNQVLAFAMLADGQVTPVSAPWLLIRTLRGGYLNACTVTENGMRLTIDDSYEDDALQLEIWIDGADIPLEAEILWQGKRVVSLQVENFVYQ